MNSTIYRAAGLVALMVLAACGDNAPAPAPVAASTAPMTDGWVGEWTGVEGTFLRIEGAEGKYQVTVQNLDGPRTFPGTKLGDRIQFERDGMKELIRATDGPGTGMKYLEEKKDCLSIVNGDGFCRD